MKTALLQISGFPVVGAVAGVHTDDRRSIYEYCWPSGAIQMFDIAQDATVPLVLGNHFHEEKSEYFLILAGGGSVHFHQFDRDGKPVGDRYVADVGPGAVVLVPPRMAHTFVLTPGSKMVCFSSQPFDQNNMDMQSRVLVDRKTREVVVLIP